MSMPSSFNQLTDDKSELLKILEEVSCSSSSEDSEEEEISERFLSLSPSLSLSLSLPPSLADGGEGIIAGNFRGKKLSRILCFFSHPRKFST